MLPKRTCHSSAVYALTLEYTQGVCDRSAQLRFGEL